MIDFRKEIQRFRPVKTLDDLQIQEKADGQLDISDYLRYLFSEKKPEKLSEVRKKAKNEDY